MKRRGTWTALIAGTISQQDAYVKKMIRGDPIEDKIIDGTMKIGRFYSYYKKKKTKPVAWKGDVLVPFQPMEPKRKMKKGRGDQSKSRP